MTEGGKLCLTVEGVEGIVREFRETLRTEERGALVIQICN